LAASSSLLAEAQCLGARRQFEAESHVHAGERTGQAIHHSIKILGSARAHGASPRAAHLRPRWTHTPVQASAPPPPPPVSRSPPSVPVQSRLLPATGLGFLSRGVGHGTRCCVASMCTNQEVSGRQPTVLDTRTAAWSLESSLVAWYARAAGQRFHSCAVVAQRAREVQMQVRALTRAARWRHRGR
jgi:hypothetical protein